MKCERWNEEIALWAGGDAVSEPFLAHLRGCGRCRRELAAMTAARAEWADWRPRSRRVSWWWGVAAAVPLLVWAGWPAPVVVEELALTMPAAPAGPGVARATRQAPVVTKQPNSRRETAVTLKILTDDPEVVILLLGDGE
jgi:hypothetical protein